MARKKKPKDSNEVGLVEIDPHTGKAIGGAHMPFDGSGPAVSMTEEELKKHDMPYISRKRES